MMNKNRYLHGSADICRRCVNGGFCFYSLIVAAFLFIF